MTASARTAARWVAISLVALLAAWLLAPAVVPIYDGIGQPDEPYRYVKPPQGSSTAKAPTTAKVVVPVRNGVSEARYANSAESGPQISLYLPAGALGAPAGATAITVTARPLAPSTPLPGDGTIVTNVYRITATAGGKDVPVVGTGNKAPTLQMRAPTAKQPGPVFERLANGTWTRSASSLRVGNDIYQSQATAFGDWALVRLAGSSSGGSGGGGGINVGLLAAGIAVLALAGIIVAIRHVRMRQVAR